MDSVIQFFQSYGVAGLLFLSFIESSISPILPDIMFIPMALAQPEDALYLATLTTAASVLGGFPGYYIGVKLGTPAIKRFVPERHADRIHAWVDKYGGWAIFLAAMAPIPFKFVTITAGAMRTRMPVFVVAAICGRAKRFMIVGALIHYYGASATEAFRFLF